MTQLELVLQQTFAYISRIRLFIFFPNLTWNIRECIDLSCWYYLSSMWSLRPKTAPWNRANQCR
jgi:hypothetical protein